MNANINKNAMFSSQASAGHAYARMLAFAVFALLAIAGTAVAAPNVTSVSATTADGFYKTGSQINITVTFNESSYYIGGDGQAYLRMNVTAEGYNVSVTTPGPGIASTIFSFLYTVQAGDTSPRLDYMNNASLTGTIRSLAGGSDADLTLPEPGAAGSLSANKDIVIDTTNPAVAINSPASSSYVNSSTTAINLTVSDTNLNYTNISAYNYTTGALVNSTTNTSSGTYVVSLGLPDGTYNITATAYDNATNTNTSTVTGIIVDTTTPVVASNVIDTVAGAYKAAAVITFNVTYNKTVVVTGTPRIVLNTAPERYANYASGNNSATLVFSYTVQAGDTAADLGATNTSALDLNSGTIKDLAGNTADNTLANNFTGRTVVIDTAAPTLTIEAPAEGQNFSSNSTVELNFTVADATSGVNTSSCKYSFDSGATNTSRPSCANITLPEMADGAKTLAVYVSDLAGNENATIVNFKVDTTAPVVAIQLPVQGYNSSTNESISLNFTAVDATTEINTSSCTYSLDGEASVAIASCANTTFNVSVNIEGTHNITVSASDIMGNVGTSSLVTFTVDLTAPTVGAISLTPSYNNSTVLFISGNTTIAATLFDNVSGLAGTCEYSLNNSTYVAGNYSTNLCNTSGVDTTNATLINVRAPDNAGNTGYGSAVGVTVDVTAPNYTWIAPDTDTFYKNGDTINVIVNITENESGVADGANCTAAIDGGVTFTGSVLYNATSGFCEGALIVESSTGDGAKNLTLTLADNVGNFQASDNRQIKIDNTAPTYTWNTPANNSTFYKNGGTLEVNVSVTDGEGTGITDGIDCNAAVAGATSVTGNVTYNDTSKECIGTLTIVDGGLDGVKNLTVTVPDKLGNNATSEIRQVSVDNTAPTYTWNTPASGAYYKNGQGVSVNVSVTDGEGTGINDGIDCNAAVAGATSVTGNVTYNDTSKECIGTLTIVDGGLDGAKQITLTVPDKLGNNATSANRTINIDNTAVTIGAVTITPKSGNWISGSSNISATVTNGSSGIASCEYYIDGTTWTTANFSAGTCTATDVDTTSANVTNMRATNGVSTVGTGTDVNVTVDVTAPDYLLIAPATDAFYKNGDTINVIVNITENESGVADGANCTPSIDDGNMTFTGDVLFNATSGACEGALVVVSSTADGAKLLRLTVADNVGNSNLSGYRRIQTDNTAPTYTWNTPANNSTFYKNGGTLEVNVSVTDGEGTGITDGIDCNAAVAGATSVTGNVTYNDTSKECIGTLTIVDGGLDGVKNLTVTVPDKLGNNATSEIRQVSVDNTAPTYTWITPVSGAYYKDGDTLAIDANVTDGTGVGINDSEACNVKIDGATASFTGTIAYNNSTGKCAGSIALKASSGLADGAHNITIEVADALGNTNVSANRSINIDNTYPVVGSVIISPSNGPYISATSALNASVTESGSGIASCEYTLDGGSSWVAGNYSSGICSAAGVNTAAATIIGMRATDNVNYTGTSATTSVIVYSTAPNVIVSGPSATQTSQSVTLTATTDMNAECRYATSDIAYGLMTSTMAGTGTAHNAAVTASEGANTYYVRCADSVGNAMAASEVINFTVDSLAPSIAGSSPSGIYTSLTAPTLEVNTSETATCQYSTTAFAWGNGTAMTNATATSHTAPLGALSDGTHSYYVLCRDAVNNTMASGFPITFVVNTVGNFNYTYSLNMGWNSVWLPRIVLQNLSSFNDSNFTVVNVLETKGNLTGSYNFVYYRNGTSCSSQNGSCWVSYDPTSLVNDLAVFNDWDNLPYWINMNATGKRLAYT